MTGYNGSSVAARLAAAIFVAGSLLGACGQKGPLYIPGVEHPEGGVRRLPLPTPASAAAGESASQPAGTPASAPVSSSVPADVGVTLPGH